MELSTRAFFNLRAYVDNVGFVISRGSNSRSSRVFAFERLWGADGLGKRYSVAGDVSHSYRCVVGCFSAKVEKELGVLVIPPE